MTIARIVAISLDGKLTVEVSPHDIDDYELGQLVEITEHSEPTVEQPPATDEGDWL